MYKKLTKLICATSTTVLVTLAPGVVFASGFALIDQSVSGMGNAYAGSAAIAEDASTVFFNPAGMTRLSDSELVGALHYINPSAKFRDSGASSETGGDGGDAGDGALVPNVYYILKISDDMVFGLGINAPFGLSTEYDPNWKGRYQGIKSEVKTININPSLAFKVDDQISVGVGVSIQQIDAELTNAVGTPVGDVSSAVEGDSLGYGFNVGVLWGLGTESRIGVAYRSKISHTLEGDATFTNVPAPVSALFPNGSIEADLDLPATFSVSAVHKVNTKWSVMGDITWTQWSVLDELVIKFDKNLPAATSTETFNWDDTLRYSVGISFNQSATTVLRAGLAFDETAIQNDADRGVRVPGNDRTWIALGAGFKVTDNANIDVGYVHLIVDDAAINTTKTDGSGAHSLVGSYEASVDIFSVQGSWKF